jgi:hypothetical protein
MGVFGVDAVVVGATVALVGTSVALVGACGVGAVVVGATVTLVGASLALVGACVSAVGVPIGARGTRQNFHPIWTEESSDVQNMVDVGWTPLGNPVPEYSMLLIMSLSKYASVLKYSTSNTPTNAAVISHPSSLPYGKG